MKKIWESILLTALAVTSVFLVNNDVSFGATQKEDIVIIYTGDLNTGLDSGIGLAGVKAYYNSLKEQESQKELVSVGNIFSNSLINQLSKGQYSIEAMNAAGYSIASFGEDDTNYGREWIGSEVLKRINFDLLSCNALELQPYKIFTYGDTKVAYIGITDPSFKNQQPRQAYEEIQLSLNKIMEYQPEYIIALGSIRKESGISAKSIIENTKGISAFINSNSSVENSGFNVKTKDGKSCLLVSPSGINKVGELRLTPNKTITNRLITSYGLRNINVATRIEELESKFKAAGDEDFAVSQVDLDIAKDGIRIVESQETKLGDLVADSIRKYTDADVAVFPASRFKANIPKGKITYNRLRKSINKEDSVSLIRLSGMDLIDVLEMSVMEYPNRYKNFLQISGVDFDIKEFRPTSVKLDENGNFQSVSKGYRVSNIKVKGKDLSLLDDYLVACPSALLENSEYTMLSSGELMKKMDISDVLMVKKYITENLKGKVRDENFNDMSLKPRIDIIVLLKKSQIEEIIRANVDERMKNKGESNKEIIDWTRLSSQNNLMIKNMKLNISGYNTLSKSKKRAVRIKWTPSKDLDMLKYQVWKSDKKYSGFKKISTTSNRRLLNISDLKKGKGYYYKVRAYKVIDGVKVYSNWSEKLYIKIS